MNAPDVGTYALWHRSRRGVAPRPVFVVAQLEQKLRILDLVESTRRRLVLREVFPCNLTVDPRRAS